MDESSDIVTFGPSTSMVEEQDTERHNIVDTEYNLKDKQEQRDDFLELFKGQMNEFNHSLVRGFDVMSNQMQNLIGIMSRKTDDSQDMSRRQMADPINRVEANSNVENRQERNIAHTIGVETETNDLSKKIDEVIKKIDRVSNEVETLKSKETRSQEFNGNNRNYDVEPRAQGSWSKFNKGNNFNRNGGTNNQYTPRGQANGSNRYDQKQNSNQGNWQRSTLGDKDRQTVQFPQRRF
ncbi:unnamed protein product [Mytilus edulis]|uniref:Uncharacterized protein n=1 Tax=Mytilus edulis TaxID=6550 RepID=A0A8S3VK89_MYTED|nr:unnamed protein product [Mytilus edulis]